MKNKNQNISLSEYINTIWFPLEIDNGENKKTTISFYRSISKHLIDYFKDTKIKSIQGENIELCLKFYRCEYKQKNGKTGLASKSIRHIYATSNSIFKSAKKRGYISENPMDLVKPPKLPRKEIKALSKQELKTFRNDLPNTSDEDNCILQLLLSTGMRRGECNGLTWDNVDFNNHQLHIQFSVTRAAGYGIVTGTPKTESSIRFIPFSENISNLLEKQKQQQQEKFPSMNLKSAFVFSSKQDPYTPLDPSSLARKVKKYLNKNGLESHSCHSLRRSYATHVLAQSGDVKSLQHLMGHADASTTLNYYTCADMEQMREAVNKFTVFLDS